MFWFLLYLTVAVIVAAVALVILRRDDADPLNILVAVTMGALWPITAVIAGFVLLVKLAADAIEARWPR